MKIDHNQLKDFITKAAAATYAGGGKLEESPERKGFRELVYTQGEWHYRDSYIGYTRSRGMEVVRFKGEVVWSSSYGGGMVDGHESLADETFEFLKKCMLVKEGNFESFRGPLNKRDEDWEYRYNQEGNVVEFNGYEEILYKGNLVFFHRIIGGLVRS